MARQLRDRLSGDDLLAYVATGCFVAILLILAFEALIQ